MQFHIVKLPTWNFHLINVNVKTFDLRIDNRGYQIGDILVMREWTEYGGAEWDFTTEWCCRKICYLERDGSVSRPNVILGLAPCDHADTGIARKLVKEQEAYEKKSRMEQRMAERDGTALPPEAGLPT
jgi:Domain of unknown function (DUF3850)